MDINIFSNGIYSNYLFRNGAHKGICLLFAVQGNLLKEKNYCYGGEFKVNNWHLGWQNLHSCLFSPSVMLWILIQEHKGGLAMTVAKIQSEFLDGRKY
jgi:hypothetical protein